MTTAILPNGAVVLSDYVVCDAHANTPLRVVTHAHYDHMLGIKDSANSCELIVLTNATEELLVALRGEIKGQAKILPLQYNKCLEYNELKITLHSAEHIVGSAQVKVEDKNGFTVVYTGDFKLPKAPILETDVLVIEATYGKPVYTRPFEDKVEDEFAKLVKTQLNKSPVYIFGYHGKLQESISILREHGVKEPVLLPKTAYKIAEIYSKYCKKLDDILSINSREAHEIIKKGKYIACFHMRLSKKIERDVTKIYMSGWEFKAPWRKIGKNEFVVALSDHSDFNGLLEYVRQSKAKYVITDNYRVGDAVALAKAIRKKLGVNAKPMPLGSATLL